MSLPKILGEAETVSVAGAAFDLRVLTRAEAARVQKMVAAKADASELEITVIGLATDTPTDEVRDWYAQTPTWAVEELMGHITRLSRLDEEAQKSG